MNNQSENINTDNLNLASIKSRIKAFIIDDLSITLIVLVILWDQVSASNGDLMVTMLIMNEAFVQIIMLKFIYQSFFIWYYGATIGKFIAKIRVIDFDSYGKVSFVNSCIRSACRILSESLFYLGFFLAYFGDSKQTFQDKLGKTLVIDV